MSLGYAEKLSYHEDLGGQLGAPELFDTDADVRGKTAELAALVCGLLAECGSAGSEL